MRRLWRSSWLYPFVGWGACVTPTAKSLMAEERKTKSGGDPNAPHDLVRLQLLEFHENASAVHDFASPEIREPVAYVALAGGGADAASNTASRRTIIAARRCHAARP